MIQGWNHVSNEICQQITNEDPKQAINELSHGIYDYAIANPGIFEAMLWYNTNHLLRTYRSLIEGFILLVIHNSFGNPVSIEESFQISIDMFTKGLEFHIS